MTQFRRDTGRAHVVRPPTVSVPAQVQESDSGERISVSRTVTPADKQLRRHIDEMRAGGDPMEVSDLEEIAAAALQQRQAYERAISADRDALDETRARLAALEAATARWRRPAQLLKGVSFGGVVAALVFCARALIAHGDAARAARQESEMVLHHEATFRALAKDLSRDCAQAAANPVICTIAARLGAAIP